jgi:catechol 2,3-dioxygenase-like lactoylglutathione lyase family enzyme
VEKLKALYRQVLGLNLVVKHDNQFVDQLTKIAEAREKERLALEAKASPKAVPMEGKEPVPPLTTTPEKHDPHVVDMHKRVERVIFVCSTHLKPLHCALMIGLMVLC